MDRVAFVYFNEQYSGKIVEVPEGYHFIYDSNYVINGSSIGFNFPCSQLKYYSQTLFPIFENLLSEGWLLDLQSTTQHIDIKDKLGILINNGKDLIGAITILKELL